MKTGSEYRHAGKMRAKKFREEQEKRGYKSVSVFLSSSFIDELNRLKEKNGMTRNDAINHIFEIYQQTVTHNEIDNVNENKKWPNTQAEILFEGDQKPGSPEHIAQLDEFILKRHKKGGEGGTMTLQKIANALNEAGLMSATGKKEWKKGGVDSAFKAAMKRKNHNDQ